MGDFFYYGQKDTIRRLNELAGRGAVMASYAPAVGRSHKMDAKKRANQTASPIKSPNNDTSTSAQRARLLSPAEVAAIRGSNMVYGDSWYHDEAIQEADKTAKH